MSETDRLPVPADAVLVAAERLAGVAHRTPVFTSRRLNAELGCELFLKCENLQRIGAFKFRGAYNALVRFSPQQRRAGALAYSSGNHAQAVALAGRLLDIPTAIVMPTDAPAVKLAATRGYGAEVVTYDRATQDREHIAAGLAEQRGMTLIPPYDHHDVIAGQGTAGLELHDEVPGLDALVTPLGGGGLLSGCALATTLRAEECEIYGVEPQAGDDGRRSLAAGEIVTIDPPATIADGAATQHLGELTFQVLRALVTDVWVVPDSDLVTAMRTLAATMKLIAEPTGVLGLAGVIGRIQADPQTWAGRRVGVVISGGNVDLARFADLVGEPGPSSR